MPYERPNNIYIVIYYQMYKSLNVLTARFFQLLLSHRVYQNTHNVYLFIQMKFQFMLNENYAQTPFQRIKSFLS